MEWESDSPCLTHTHSGQGHRSPGRHSGWELEFRDCRAIPERGLLLTAEKWMEWMWERRLWWKMPVEESRAAKEARWYCWVMCRGWKHPHSLSLPTRQHPQLNNREAGLSKARCGNYRAGPHPGCPFKCLMCGSTGQDPSQRGPSMCLMHQTTEKDRRQGSPLSAWTGRATEKNWPKRPSDRQLQEAQSKTLRAP